MLNIRINYLLLSLLLYFISSFTDLSGQIIINSPYSYYGIGSIRNNNNTSIMSMGGISYALRSPNIINVSNPASYTAFDSTSFIFEGGIFSKYVNLKTSYMSQDANYTSLSYLLFGFPVVKWWRTSFGVLPFSNVGYNVFDEQEMDNIGNVGYLYEGAGGINNVYWGNAFKITKNLSFGFNIAYLFGTIDNSIRVTYPDSIYFFNTKTETSITSNDIYLNYGIQYYKELKNDISFCTGLDFSYSTNISAKKDYLVNSFLGTYSNIDIIKDTIVYESGVKGEIVLPTSIGFGVIFSKTNKWLVGADYNWQNWKEFSIFEKKDSLNNSMRISLGGQFTPDINSISSYWEKVNYRLGLRYNQTYLNLRDTRLNEFGVSFGFGLPLKRTKSTLNFGFEFGYKGTTDNYLIKENFINMSFGVSIYEWWFIKRRYK
ncbi:MAG: hypothetical protein K8R58_13940 [Bacteroidales bacterium]|nr:hypothetical protein [Bacteroidales bacterium]